MEHGTTNFPDYYLTALRRTENGFDVYLHCDGRLERLYDVKAKVVSRIFGGEVAYFAKNHIFRQDTSRRLQAWERTELKNAQEI